MFQQQQQKDAARTILEIMSRGGGPSLACVSAAVTSAISAFSAATSWFEESISFGVSSVMVSFVFCWKKSCSSCSLVLAQGRRSLNEISERNDLNFAVMFLMV